MKLAKGCWVFVMLMGLTLGPVGTMPSSWAQTLPAVQLPVTAQDHLALVKSYEDKAATYRKEADYHRAMLVEAGEVERINPKATVHPRYEAMRKHCEPIIRDAEQLAKDMDKFAEWHRMRAAELEGR